MINYIIGFCIGVVFVGVIYLGLILDRLKGMHGTLMLIHGALTRGTYR